MKKYVYKDKKKYIHKVIINNPKGRGKTYTYNFGRTKDIKITIYKGAICISAELTKMYDKNEMLEQDTYLFPDAIKKALLIYLITYSENISIKTIAVQIDDEYEDVVNTSNGEEIPILFLINGKLVREVCKNFSVSEINGILSQTKSSADSRLASLMALITSKSKVSEAERFIYLWMAFNGMYGYFANRIADTHNCQIRREYKQIIYMQKLLGIGKETIDEDDKSRLAYEVISLIRKYNCGKITRNSLENGKDMDFGNNILSVLKKKKTDDNYDISAYGYLLTQFSYYFRCNIIHASKPLALFSYTNDIELKCLKIINDLLEEFMDDNLHRWFDSKYEMELDDKASNMVLI